MFWMATLNPGGKTRRRRKLTPWQRMVKRHGGVQGALKARRAGKRGHRKGRRRKLSAWNRMVKKYGGVKAAVKARRKLRHRHTRKFGWNANSATKRGRRSRRRGGKVGRRNVMRRTRRARRTRRNAWHGAPRKHRAAALKGWRKRRKSGRVRVKRHRRGGRRRRTSKIALMRAWARSLVGRRNPRRRRKYKKNSVVPVSWNGRRRRRKYRRNAVLSTSWNGRRRRRSYRRNSVLSTSWNPANIAGGLMQAPGQILSRLGEFVDIGFWTETGIPVVGGFVLSRTLGAKVYGFISEKITLPTAVAPFLRIASDAVSGAALSWAVGRFLPIGNKAKIAQGIWLGTVVNVAYSVLKEVLPSGVKDAIGLSGLGQNSDLSSKMRDAVARRVEAELSGYGMSAYLTQRESRLDGMGAYLTQRALQDQGVGEFVTDRQLRSQNDYGPTPSGDLRDYDVARTETTF